MEQFRALIYQKASFDPFEHCVTLASTCVADFLKNHLKPHTIGIVPAKGYFSCSNQSEKAFDFLAFKSFLLKQPIQTGKHYLKEKKLGQFSIDGVCHNKKLLIDFHGCYYHGCPTCFNFIDYNSSQKTLMNELYEKTKYRDTEIRELMKKELPPGYRYEVVWEHDFENLKKSVAYKMYLKSNNREEVNKKTDATISERGCFYGGRVNAIRFFVKKTPTTEIRYRDICSLYPFVNKYKPYPKGHPQIITSNFSYAYGAYFGIIKAKILPPKKLYHPLLPKKINGKLMFVLCFTCAKNEQNSDCNHTDEERALFGEWCSPEVYLATLHGYKIKKLYCVLHYTEKIEYLDENNPGLFGAYIDKWLKTKIESSGWPTHVKSEKEKQDFLRVYKEKENITLNPDNMEFNAGMRTMSKLFCNSLWGRIGMNMDKLQSEIVNDMTEVIEMLFDTSKSVSSYRLINDERFFVEFRHVNEGVRPNLKGSVFIAAFVTCWARIVIFHVIHKLGKRVIYYDTDSVCYVWKEGEYEPPLGTMLGEWTDEIPPGLQIEEFAATGPKSYAVKYSDGSNSVKIKGVSQNYSNRKLLSFDSMKGYVNDLMRNKGRISQGVDIEKRVEFRRDKHQSSIRKVTGSKKTLTFVNNKVKKYVDATDPYCTYPFGF